MSINKWNENVQFESIVFWVLGKIYIWQLRMISCFCVNSFFRKQGCDRYLSKTQRISNGNDNNENNEIIFIEGNIFLTSLCMISLFSCHSGKQGCGRYLSKTQRISNNIKIVLHPSLQAAISFSCCFLYHWKFSSNTFFLIISFAQLTKDFSSFSVCSC